MVKSEYLKNNLEIREISYEFFVNSNDLVVLKLKLQKYTCSTNEKYL